MNPGSVAVRVGYRVAAGQFLGTVGNSGNTMEPHLHIGVIQGRGPVVLPFPGDVTLSAPDGALRLLAGKGVSIETPNFEVRAGAVEIEAASLTQRFENACQWVKGLFELRAGRSRVVVEGTSHQVAERTIIRSDKETKIDGDKIYIG